MDRAWLWVLWVLGAVGSEVQGAVGLEVLGVVPVAVVVLAVPSLAVAGLVPALDTLGTSRALSSAAAWVAAAWEAAQQLVEAVQVLCQVVHWRLEGAVRNRLRLGAEGRGLAWPRVHQSRWTTVQTSKLTWET